MLCLSLVVMRCQPLRRALCSLANIMIIIAKLVSLVSYQITCMVC
ncbi:acetyltransferase [Vibrio cholerae]|nr:acetyltransferase [Vibrio cholerae]